MSSFTKLLIANRGEIACRVIRSARGLGLRTVAVYSDADAGALHVASADESIRIGPSNALESYLSMPAILEAAKRTGAEAIHPGYGFLSENADFADACASAGLIFVGPPADAMRRLGNKARAKQLAIESGVPCIKGYQGGRQDDASLSAEAAKIGFPLLIKAAAGGGGRGMRRVESASDLPAALAGARMESKNAFGSDELILEQLVESARHVEIQIIADAHGLTLALGERDCSVQRRHQKIIEESPCPVMTEKLRAEMFDAAKSVASAAGYINAGTVEFLLDHKGAFYFLEMNTRLQVEHPVTEMVTGFDLVELQLRVARGEPLPIRQSDVRFTGHAIEARVYAEDPSQAFLPQTGTVVRWDIPTSPGVRVDHGLRPVSVVTSFYDPMLAKVIAHGADRDDARLRLLSALQNTVLFGVNTNIAFLNRILADPVFKNGQATTQFLDSSSIFDDMKSESVDPVDLAIACVALIESASSHLSPEDRGWRSTGPSTTPIRLSSTGQAITLKVTYRGDQYTVSSDDQSITLNAVRFTGDAISWTTDGHGDRAACRIDGNEIYFHRNGRSMLFQDVTYAPPADAAASHDGAIKSPMSGRLIRLCVEVGQSAAKGDVLAIVEAMKMENQITAPRTGVVSAIHVVQGNQVDANQLLITLADGQESAETPLTK